MIYLLDAVDKVLMVVTWIIVVQAVLSWLFVFNVINTYNPTVRTIWDSLNRLTDPLYRPLRRIMPDFGGLDLSPMIVLLILWIIRGDLIPYLMRLTAGA
jgi:YggT family protein